MRPDATDLYRVTERFPDGAVQKYVAFKPVFGFGALTWWMNRMDLAQRVETGSFDDRGDAGFAVLPEEPGSPLCVFEPLNVKNVKDAGIWGASDLLAQWDEDEDVLEFYREYFSPLRELPVSAFESADAELDRLLEQQGKKVPPGTRHKWRDNFWYEKQNDGSWRRVKAKSGQSGVEGGVRWADQYPLDSHPEIPKSTKDVYWSAEKSEWSPERKKLHDQIFDEVRPMLFGGAVPVPPDEMPQFTYILGPPSSGKSTREGHLYHNTVKLDPDKIVERLPEFQRAKELGVRSGASSVVGEALQMNNRLVEEAESGRYNYILEGTGQNLNWMQNTLFPRLVKRGYKINIIMAHVSDLDELYLRGESRGQATSRFVPPDIVAKAWEALPVAFKALTTDERVDTLALVDTGRRAGKRSQVVSYSKSDEGEEVLDKDFFNSVMAAALKAEAKAKAEAEAKAKKEKA